MLQAENQTHDAHAIVFLVVTRRLGRPIPMNKHVAHVAAHVEDGNLQQHQIQKLQRLLEGCDLPAWRPGWIRRQFKLPFWDDPERVLGRGFVCGALLCRIPGTQVQAVLSRRTQDIRFMLPLYPRNRHQHLIAFEIEDVVAMSRSGGGTLPVNMLQSDHPSLLPMGPRKQYQSSTSSFRRECFQLTAPCVDALMAVPCCKGVRSVGSCAEVVQTWFLQGRISRPALALQLPPGFCVLILRGLWHAVLLDSPLPPLSAEGAETSVVSVGQHERHEVVNDGEVDDEEKHHSHVYRGCQGIVRLLSKSH